jgi:hypothetical protein
MGLIEKYVPIAERKEARQIETRNIKNTIIDANRARRSGNLEAAATLYETALQGLQTHSIANQDRGHGRLRRVAIESYVEGQRDALRTAIRMRPASPRSAS